MSIAIIQKLGKGASRLQGNSYAYRSDYAPKNHETEYLYEYWFTAHSRFISDLRKSAEKSTKMV